MNKHLIYPSAVLGLTLGLSACQDYDAGFSAQDIREHEYSKNFEEIFGKVDPNQDWSMAMQVTANVSVGSSDSYVAIYTDKPLYADTKILDAFQGNNHTFEALEGTQQVFAIVRNEGKTIVAGYFDIVDGNVNISGFPVAKAKSNTRAFGDGSAVTKGYVEANVINARSLEEKYVSGGMYKSLDEWRTYAAEQATLGNMTTANYAPFSSDCVKPAYYNFSAAIINPAKAVKSDKEGYYWDNKVWTLAELRAWGETNKSNGTFHMGNYAQKTPFNSDCVKAAGYDFTNAVLNTDKVTIANQDGFYWNGEVKTLAEWRSWAQAKATNGEITTNTYGDDCYNKLTPFSDDCASPIYDFSSATINAEKVVSFTKDGYYCEPGKEWGNSKQVYSLAELKDIIKSKGQYESTWPLADCTWDSDHWNTTNATVAENCQLVSNGSFYYNEHPNPFFADETAMKNWTKDNDKKNSGPYTNCYFTDRLNFENATLDNNKVQSVSSGNCIYNNTIYANEQALKDYIASGYEKNNGAYTNCYFEEGFDFTNATINITDKIRQYGIEVHPGGYVYDQTYYADDAAIQAKVRTSDLQNNGPFTNCWFPSYLDFTDATLDPATPKGMDPNAWMINLTYLDGVETEPAQPWTLELGYQLFGPGSFFMEQEYYFGKGKNKYQEKTELYGSTPAEKLATMEKIEAGFSITTKNGSEIEIPFIYGATNISDQFGYVYYKDGQDPLTQPHYILMKNGKPTTNIYYNEWGVEANAVGEMSLAGWRTKNDDKVTPIDDGQPLYGMSFDTKVYGTKYKLSFFGEKHDKPASYQFDAGYHIVFFICPGTIDEDDPRGVSSHQNININYSLPELNARIFNGHMYEGSENAKHPSLTYTAGTNPEGIVKAAAWTSNGMTFMGFEDGGGDEDLNDIVFWVEGDYTPDQELVEVETVIKNNSLSWIFACEDLGGTFDYDFNDVVWEFAKDYDVVSETKVERDSKGNIIRIIEGDPAPVYKGAKINLLAAGGTLPIELLYDGAALEKDEKTELHQIFGQSASQSYSVVNVGAKVSTPAVTLKEFSSSEDVSLETIKNKCKIAVHQNDGTTTYVQAPTIDAPKKGKDNTPQVIVLPGAWEWPQEEVFINSAYPNFKSWTEDKTWANWSENYDSSKTTKR